jgi:hypothetical protein
MPDAILSFKEEALKKSLREAIHILLLVPLPYLCGVDQAEAFPVVR